MSITALKGKLSEHHRAAKMQRDLNRAIYNAPTPASRQELLSLYLR